MFALLRPWRELRSTFYNNSFFLSLSRHTYTTSKLRSSPTQWGSEEVYEKLNSLEIAVDNGQSPDLGYLAMLLAPLQHHKDGDILDRVLKVVQRSGITLTESLGSALVTRLAERERINDIQYVVETMDGRLRVQSQSSVLSVACRHGDVDLALQYLTKWTRGQPLPNTLVESLVALSRESQQPEIMETLLSVLGKTRQSVNEDSVREIIQWANRQSYTTCDTVTVSASRICSHCGNQLDKALSDKDHHQLLDAINNAVHSEGLGFSPELISNLSRLKQRLVSMTTPYRAVVDGLNVSHVGATSFSVMQVMDVVNQLTATIGGPVLVVARKHLAKEMDHLPSFYSSVPRSHDFHVFTTHVNEISDDICVIYAALTTGSDCYFVSNDHMSDNASMLSSSYTELFTMWQASRQITVQPNDIRLMYPTDHGQLTQKNDGVWHIPIAQPPPQPHSQETKPAWIMRGRHSWNQQPSTTWLCLRTNKH